MPDDYGPRYMPGSVWVPWSIARSEPVRRRRRRINWAGFDVRRALGRLLASPLNPAKGGRTPR